MKHDYIVEFLAYKVKEVLRGNFPPASQLQDEVAIDTVRSLFATPTAQTALERGSDTARAFAVRAINRVISDVALPAPELLNRLQSIMDKLDVKGASQVSRGTGRKFWLKKPPAH
jgi:hypothetical protein